MKTQHRGGNTWTYVQPGDCTEATRETKTHGLHSRGFECNCFVYSRNCERKKKQRPGGRNKGKGQEEKLIHQVEALPCLLAAWLPSQQLLNVTACSSGHASQAVISCDFVSSACCYLLSALLARISRMLPLCVACARCLPSTSNPTGLVLLAPLYRWGDGASERLII